MNVGELFLLSPYSIPAKDSLMLAEEDVSCILNGYLALWHPLLLLGARKPPRIASPYDHEQPAPGQFFALPESPPVFMPDDWDHRLSQAASAKFQAVVDRNATHDNVKAALRALVAAAREAKPPTEPPSEKPPEGEAAANIPAEQPATNEPPAVEVPSLTGLDVDVLLDRDASTIAPFRGIGFGCMHLTALFEAMDHGNLIEGSDFWPEVQRACVAWVAGDFDQCREHLKSAAKHLLGAREALYPVTIHLIDLCVFDEEKEARLPAACLSNKPVNVIASAEKLEAVQREQPALLEPLREGMKAEQIEMCVGAYREREDGLLPLESQLWNLQKGLRVAQEILGGKIRVFARKRFAAHPQLPLLLASCGIQKALLLTFDDSAMPIFQSCVINWAGSDAKQVDAFTRTPHRADSPQSYFHVAHYLQRTIAQDHAATYGLLHRGEPPAPWYNDWVELNKLGNVLGTWTTFSNYFGEVMAGEYASAASADEFHDDYLLERCDARLPNPVSTFAAHHHMRRRIDVAWSLAAILRGLAGKNDTLRIDDKLSSIEARLEVSPGGDAEPELAAVQQEIGHALAGRLLSRATGNDPGLLFLNPCSYTRRIAVEVDGVKDPLPIEGPLKACQLDGDKARLVVEIPSFGFAWIPKTGKPGTPPQPPRLKLADKAHVRNEFFEAEIDPATGGLRGIWDHRSRINRLGQMLVFNPGSVMRADKIEATICGAALGEVVSEGTIRDETDPEKVLARYRQRIRAWLGRPILDMRIEITPEKKPIGYPWHSYYGARFAWRDERTMVMRGVNGTAFMTSHTRPQSSEFLEWRLGQSRTTLFTAGLPFLQRHGTRMLDLVLMPEGETCPVFDIGLGIDREYPMLTAQGLITPVTMLEVDKGPPHVGTSGWLFHLDATNLLVTSLRPDATGSDAVTARLLEGALHGTQAEFRCVRNPKRAALVNALGEEQNQVHVYSDAAVFDVVPNDLAHLRLEFS